MPVVVGRPWSDHLDGPVWELLIRLRDVAARIAYWWTIVLLTVFRKTRQHDQKQIDRAVRAQKACERDHRGAAAETHELSTLPARIRWSAGSAAASRCPPE